MRRFLTKRANWAQNFPKISKNFLRHVSKFSFCSVPQSREPKTQFYFKIKYNDFGEYTEFYLSLPMSFESKKLVLKNENCTVGRLKEIFRNPVVGESHILVSKSESNNLEGRLLGIV